MNVEAKSSSFQSVILNIVRKELNLMLSEIFQMDDRAQIDFQDYERLTKIVLKEVANKRIRSPHIPAKKALSYIRMLDELECHTEIKNELEEKSWGCDYKEGKNPYSESPF